MLNHRSQSSLNIDWILVVRSSFFVFGYTYLLGWHAVKRESIVSLVLSDICWVSVYHCMVTKTLSLPEV